MSSSLRHSSLFVVFDMIIHHRHHICVAVLPGEFGISVFDDKMYCVYLFSYTLNQCFELIFVKDID